MFPKKKRINKELFKEIIKTGVVFSSSLFTFKYINTSNQPRYTFVVPKNVLSKAVDRNKLKRRGFNVLKDFVIKKNQGIFFYKKGANKASLQEIKDNICFLLKKSKSN
jgi:ribonuclease P protein component